MYVEDNTSVLMHRKEPIMAKTEPVMKIIRDEMNGKTRIVEKECEQIIGKTKKVITKIKTETWQEQPGFYNDGVGGTNVRTLTTDEIRDAFSDRFLGKRIETKHELTEINNNGKVSIPNKPLLIKKEVIRETPNHKTETHYGYGTGYRVSKVDHTTGESHYDYLSKKGMRDKK